MSERITGVARREVSKRWVRGEILVIMTNGKINNL